MPPLSRLGFALWLTFSALLHAHPDHSATQKKLIEIVPSDTAAPTPNQISIRVESGQRLFEANGLPDHSTGRFPNRDNPNAIRAQTYRFKMPAAPQPAPSPIALVSQPFGIAVNGVLFDPGTAEMWQNDPQSGWRYEAKGGGFSLGLDSNNAHVQPNGAYHYHGLPTELVARLSGGKPAMTLVGWAADGFPIYAKWGHADPADAKSAILELKSSYRLKTTARPGANGQPGGTPDGVFVEDYEYAVGSGDLDECGGRTGVTPEFPSGTYYYVLTEDYPFVPRFFRGEPDPSFKVRGPGPRPPRRL